MDLTTVEILTYLSAFLHSIVRVGYIEIFIAYSKRQILAIFKYFFFCDDFHKFSNCAHKRDKGLDKNNPGVLVRGKFWFEAEICGRGGLY